MLCLKKGKLEVINTRPLIAGHYKSNGGETTAKALGTHDTE